MPKNKMKKAVQVEKKNDQDTRHLVSGSWHIEYSAKSKRHGLRKDTEFRLSDVNRQAIKNAAKNRYGITDWTLFKEEE